MRHGVRIYLAGAVAVTVMATGFALAGTAYAGPRASVRWPGLTADLNVTAVAPRGGLVIGPRTQPAGIVADQATAGGVHTCTLLNLGTANCWGSNAAGQLGDGSTTNSLAPVIVSGLVGATQISAGADATCALLAGTVKCWGANGAGELGTGGFAASSVPVAVKGLSGVTQISSGNRYSCALKGNGTVWCWGLNGTGQLGNGTTSSSAVPVEVAGLSTATGLSAGDAHACAVLKNATAVCWGGNGYGELGNGLTTDSPTPVAVTGLTNVVQVAAGDHFSCAVINMQPAECWGHNGHGELGNGTITDSLSPVAVTGISGVTQMSLGQEDGCALTNHGISCWGRNSQGQLGDGTTSDSSSPVAVSGIKKGVASVTVGSDDACAVVAGSVQCWGDGLAGELGSGSTASTSVPVGVNGLLASWATPPAEVSNCPGHNAEVEDATSGPDVYVEWIGCSGIGFARSVNAGQTFEAPITLPGSAVATTPRGTSYSWDPAVTVSPSGTVYASFMYFNSLTDSTYPIVDASLNQGATFPQVSRLPIPTPVAVGGDWGDRDFIAAGTGGRVYVTWDYGPKANEVKFFCPKGGSCSFLSGDLNAVIQSSSNGGKTWSGMHHVSPHYPIGGADSAPIVIQPSGTLDVLYQRMPTNASTFALSPGHEYFTRSINGGKNWSTPIIVGKSSGTESLQEWWIDGDISTDAAGNLYATWDTQSASADVGWLSYSTNGGKTWSTPLRVTPATGTAEELVQSIGSTKGTAEVGWQTPASPKGYATFVRPYSIAHGWLAPAPLMVSVDYGAANVWPGDTFGIVTLPGATTSVGPPVLLSWGSATMGTTSEIYSAIARLWP